MESNFPKNRSFKVLFALLALVLILTFKSSSNNIQLISESSAKTEETVSNNIDPASLKCLSENIYFEASNQSLAGKLGVGLVVLNRVESPRYPKTICGVIRQKSNGSCQFSWVCSNKHYIDRNSDAWKQSQYVAKKLLSDKDSTIDITEGAIYYHANYVNPSWKKKMIYVAQIDNHMFYRDND